MIFGVLKKSLLKVGIGHSDVSNSFESRTKNTIVLVIFTFCFICMFKLLLVSSDLNEMFAGFFVSITCILNISTYSYILYKKSELYNSMDELEKSLHESKISVCF